MCPTNYLTIDFERLGDRDIYQWASFSQAEEYDMMSSSLDLILTMLDKYSRKATFFVLGEIIRDYPEICKRMKKEGHEVGLHGWAHKRLDGYSREEFERDLNRALVEYEKALRAKPMGFRAPQFSVGKETSWVFEVLGFNGFQYDSSIYPCGIGFYGGNTGPLCPYYPSKEDPSIPAESGKVMEFPALVYKLNRIKIPAAGGFWSRILGYKFMSKIISETNRRGCSATIYLHNWEFVDNNRWLRKKTSNWRNYGIPIYENFQKLLSSHRFSPIASFFN